MEARQQKGIEWPIYLRSLLLVTAGIAVAVFLQIALVYQEFNPRFFIIPTLVALLVGGLIGHLAVLKKRLRQASAEFRAMVDIAQEFTFLRNVDGSFQYISPACEALTGYAPQAFYADKELLEKLIHPDSRERWEQCQCNSGGKEGAVSSDLRIIARSGKTLWVAHTCAPLFDDQGRRVGVRSSNLDITQRKRDQSRIEHMAHYDPLTDLPNRHLLTLFVETQAKGHGRFAVLFIDLSRFKNINDSLGHSAGDQLLREMARRLERACRNEGLLCRFGGDEFVVVHPALGAENEARVFARTLLDTIEAPVFLHGSEFCLSGTVGIAFFPEHGADTETLIRNADAAMYRAKRSGDGTIAIYHADYSREAARFVLTENALNRALKNGDLHTWYQPKVELQSGRIIGLEALARWFVPEGDAVAPEEFITIAEETGQIAEIGRQVVQQVLADLLEWDQLGITLPVALNVSPRQFTDSSFWHCFESSVAASGLSPTMLEIEITEQVFLHDIDATAARLCALRDAGVKVALDDFGTGYSSFNYMRRLPIGVIKLDRSFVCDVERDPVSQAILRAMTGVCTELGLTLVAEGVETESQREILLSHGCRIAQGYLFHRPMPAATLVELLKKRPPALSARRPA